jgi:hypothetical protein
MRRLVRLVLGGGHHRGLATSAGRGAESKRPRREPSPGTSRPRVPRTNDPAPDFTSLENMLTWEAERVVKVGGHMAGTLLPSVPSSLVWSLMRS